MPKGIPAIDDRKKQLIDRVNEIRAGNGTEEKAIIVAYIHQARRR